MSARLPFSLVDGARLPVAMSAPPEPRRRAADCTCEVIDGRRYVAASCPLHRGELPEELRALVQQREESKR